MSKVSYSPVLVAAAMLAATSAGAHITLENREATIGQGYKAVFMVPHGCAGSATTKIRVNRFSRGCGRAGAGRAWACDHPA